MILSNPLVFLSSCQDIGNLPMTHLLGSTKTWACNCLRVTCINEFHGEMRCIERMSCGGSGCSARASRTPRTAIKHSNRSNRSSICLYSIRRYDYGHNKQRRTHKNSRVDGCTKSNHSLARTTETTQEDKNK